MAVFSDADELKQELTQCSPGEFFETHIARTQTIHFDAGRIDFVIECLYDEYGIRLNQEELVVVGSSKLGFAIHNKIKDSKIIAPAFRAFSSDSDIDLSICSPALFDLFWQEITEYACSKNYMPYTYKKLAEYLTYGWLRQDQLPRPQPPYLVKCDNIWSVQGRIRKNRRKGHPKISFGIFHNLEHLKLYQSRSILLCRRTLENPL